MMMTAWGTKMGPEELSILTTVKTSTVDSSVRAFLSEAEALLKLRGEPEGEYSFEPTGIKPAGEGARPSATIRRVRGQPGPTIEMSIGTGGAHPTSYIVQIFGDGENAVAGFRANRGDWVVGTEEDQVSARIVTAALVSLSEILQKELSAILSPPDVRAAGEPFTGII